MTPAELPEDLRQLHGQITDCEARGFTYLAAALRPMLQTQIRERGLGPVLFAPEPTKEAK